MFAIETDPHPCFCSIPKAGVTGEVGITTYEWPCRRSQVPNMVSNEFGLKVSTQTCSNYKLDLLFTPAYVPFPSRGARDERKEKALSGNEGVDVPTRSLFFIFCSTKKIDFCFLNRIWTKYYWTSQTVQLLMINILRRHLNVSTQR